MLNVRLLIGTTMVQRLAASSIYAEKKIDLTQNGQDHVKLLI
jgi:hypothetical protein